MTVTIEEAQASLRHLTHHLMPGEELIITENHQEVARLTTSHCDKARLPRQSGLGQGSILFMASDFDEPLEDFEDDAE